MNVYQATLQFACIHFVNVHCAGFAEVDQTLTMFLSTAMFVGGVLGFLLDNIVPGNWLHIMWCYSLLHVMFIAALQLQHWP